MDRWDEIRAERVSEEQLTAWGEKIGASTALPLVLALRGELGAGKSVLARAVARGAGVEGAMPSPTFNLLFRYTGAKGAEVIHIDLFRLEAEDDVWELGWSELGEGRQIVLIEWPERAEALLPGDRWDIQLAVAGEGERAVFARSVGEPPGLPDVRQG